MHDGTEAGEPMGIFYRTTAVVGAAVLAMSLLIAGPAANAQEGTVSEGMTESFEASVWAAVDSPTALEWASDGRLFVMTVTGKVMVFTPAGDGSTGIGSTFHRLPDTNLAIGIAVDPDDPDLVYALGQQRRRGTSVGDLRHHR